MKSITVLITGAGGTVGQIAVSEFLMLGANVVGIYHGAKTREESESFLPIENCDLGNAECARELISQVINRYESIDVLVNIAGGFTFKEAKNTEYADIEDMININFKSVFNMTNASLEYLKKSTSGRVINIGAIGAITAGSGMAAYSISKSAVMRYTEALAEEVKSSSLTVNAILPSIIDTPQNRFDMPHADTSSWVTPIEIVNVMAFLASEKSTGINGALIPVKGRV